MQPSKKKRIRVLEIHANMGHTQKKSWNQERNHLCISTFFQGILDSDVKKVQNVLGNKIFFGFS